jgi:hypothetical protein
MLGGGNNRSSLIMNFLNYLQQGGSNHGLTVSNLVHDMEDDEDNEYYLDEDEIAAGNLQYHGMLGDSDEVEGYGDEEDGEEEYEEVYEEEEDGEEEGDEGEEEMPELDDMEQHSHEEHQQEEEQPHHQGTGCSKGIVEIERDSESD